MAKARKAPSPNLRESILLQTAQPQTRLRRSFLRVRLFNACGSQRAFPARLPEWR